MASSANTTHRAAIVYGTTAGVGGLGYFAASAVTSLTGSKNAEVFALGPSPAEKWPLPGGLPHATWIQSPHMIAAWRSRYSWLRWRTGRYTLLHDRALGKWALQNIEMLRPHSCYLFTQVSVETLRWARENGVSTALDNPNTHIRNYRQVCENESQRWLGKKFSGHPTSEMMERIEEEYSLADRIRVHSTLAKSSMMQSGIAENKIHYRRQTVNLDRFRPAQKRPSPDGPLRVCYVGSVDLRKGVFYLLRAIRALGSKRIRLRIVGATGDRDCARLFAEESSGLDVQCAPGDPLQAYQESELFVLPTLEDGLGMVLLEAQACALPSIVTSSAGAAECVEPGKTGWIVPSGQVGPLTGALEDALRNRNQLSAMGQKAREDVERYASADRLRELATWFYEPASSEMRAG